MNKKRTKYKRGKENSKRHAITGGAWEERGNSTTCVPLIHDSNEAPYNSTEVFSVRYR